MRRRWVSRLDRLALPACHDWHFKTAHHRWQVNSIVALHLACKSTHNIQTIKHTHSTNTKTAQKMFSGMSLRWCNLVKYILAWSHHPPSINQTYPYPAVHSYANPHLRSRDCLLCCLLFRLLLSAYRHSIHRYMSMGWSTTIWVDVTHCDNISVRLGNCGGESDLWPALTSLWSCSHCSHSSLSKIKVSLRSIFCFPYFQRAKTWCNGPWG